MDYVLSVSRYKLYGVAEAFKYAVLPHDRPSPLFLLFTTLINGGLLVWSFDVVLSATCHKEHSTWLGLGIMNAVINDLFSIALMASMRNQIRKGIHPSVSNVRLYLTQPVLLLYFVYLIWEIAWMIVASKKASKNNKDGCSNHFSVQSGFFSFYFILGLTIFAMTFATEWCRSPRWRVAASTQWRRRNQPELDEQVEGIDEAAQGDDFSRTQEMEDR
ncbi:hypothetical protein, conserved [Angomonas deanei]|uniref:Uncharacterized protein n=1 Tax=Angomonas deanei TaxID=59799 RepID=A0A7G2CJC0_9TRYP|nr:hypothetical protein, conserved [Angomonas deanei]